MDIHAIAPVGLRDDILHQPAPEAGVSFPPGAFNQPDLGVRNLRSREKAFAAWVKTQNTKGWVMAVIGYADTTGSSQRNIDLSERRANAVIYYIVSKYKMSTNWLVQPFGYGQLEPAAENATRSGRSKNRRVEIRLMGNKGIAGTTNGRQLTSSS